MLSHEPEHFGAWYHRGLALVQLGKDNDAVQTFEKARQIEPHDIALLFSEGKAWYRLEQFEEAIHLFDIALGREPGNGEILFEKAKALACIGRHDEAQETFRLAFTQITDNYEPAYLRGLSLMVLERYEDADMAFDAALALNPDNPDIWSQKGGALMYTPAVTSQRSLHTTVLSGSGLRIPVHTSIVAGLLLHSTSMRMPSVHLIRCLSLSLQILLPVSSAGERSFIPANTRMHVWRLILPLMATRKIPGPCTSVQHRLPLWNAMQKRQNRLNVFWYIPRKMQMPGSSRAACLPRLRRFEDAIAAFRPCPVPDSGAFRGAVPEGPLA